MGISFSYEDDTPIEVKPDKRIERYINEPGNIDLQKKWLYELTEAIQESDLELIDLLIELDFDVNAKDDNWNTLLYKAASMDKYPICNLLIKKGANPELRNNTFSSSTPLHIAAEKGYLETVRTLVENKACINVLSIERKTPLYLAVENERVEVTRFLLENGANPDFSDCKSRTPLYVTTNLAITKLLITHKASVNSSSNEGLTPLHEAIQYGRYEKTELLIKAGTNLQLTTNKYETCLKFAIMEKSLRIVKLLVEAGDYVDRRDHFGKRPIDWLRLKPVMIGPQFISRNIGIPLKDMQLKEFLEQEIRMEISRKRMLLFLVRELDKESIFYRDYLPLDIFKLLLMYSGYLKRV